MNSSLDASFIEADKNLTKDRTLHGTDLRSDVASVVARGRELADDLASEARDAVEVLADRGQVAADRLRGYVSEGRERLSKAARRVSGYADDNTALVALASLGVGALLGFAVTRRFR
ncbi:MAG: hypothetical protein ACYDBY_12545 [Thermoanaerobaculia bacterium]